jgi:hypothetical protein
VSTKKFRPDVDAPVYKGGYSPYDIIKEGTIAIVVVGILVVLLAVVFGSPDEPAITIKKWSNAAPIDFATTALSELNGTSISASYGAPYNHNGPGQQLGPLALARWVGVRIPINSADDFVIDPLQSQPNNPALKSSLTAWETASASTRTTWVANYTKVAGHMTFTNGNVVVPAANAGPVPVMINDLTHMARTGALDTALLSGNGFYTTDYTKPLLFIADGSYLGDLAQKQHMLGNQWGMMNETGSYPGQPWLWLYTFWYQVPPMNSSSNGDIEVFAIMILLTLVLFFLPLIPGLRAIPRKVRLYRVIWREHYRDA